MFSGIIEEKGNVVNIKSSGNGKQIVVAGNIIFGDLKIGDSVAINGVCQTAVSISGNTFVIDTVNETLKKTTFCDLRINSEVNLERAILPTTRLGGHFLQGHIDTTGQILQICKLNNSAEFTISFPLEFRKYLARTGSIAIDGVSLTTSHIYDSNFKVAVIPHTIKSTIFYDYKIGDKVNLEFDIIGKYIDSLINHNGITDNANNSTILSNLISQHI